MNGDTFRELRIREGYSLHDAAEGVTSIATLSRFENGLISIGTEKLMGCLNNIGLTFLEFASAETDNRENQYNYFNDLRKLVELDKTTELTNQVQLQRARYDHSHSTIDFHTLVLAAGMNIKAGGANVLTTAEVAQVLHELRRSDVWGEIELLQFEAAAPLLTSDDDLALAQDLAIHLDDIERRSSLLYRDAWSALLNALEALIYRDSSDATVLYDKLRQLHIHEEALVMQLRLDLLGNCVQLCQGDEAAARQSITQQLAFLRDVGSKDLAKYYERVIALLCGKE